MCVYGGGWGERKWEWGGDPSLFWAFCSIENVSDRMVYASKTLSITVIKLLEI